MSSESPQRTSGFRFFATDALVIAAFVIAAFALYRMSHPLWWLLITVAVHFFLFCNVFRLRRNFEITWAILFVINVGAWFGFDELSAGKVLACQLPITLILIAVEIRSPRYHGIQARRLNPRFGQGKEL